MAHTHTGKCCHTSRQSHTVGLSGRWGWHVCVYEFNHITVKCKHTPRQWNLLKPLRQREHPVSFCKWVLIPLRSLSTTWGFTHLLKEQKDPSRSCYRSKEAFGSAKWAKILTHINAENELVKTERGGGVALLSACLEHTKHWVPFPTPSQIRCTHTHL